MTVSRIYNLLQNLVTFPSRLQQNSAQMQLSMQDATMKR